MVNTFMKYFLFCLPLISLCKRKYSICFSLLFRIHFDKMPQYCIVNLTEIKHLQWREVSVFHQSWDLPFKGSANPEWKPCFCLLTT